MQVKALAAAILLLLGTQQADPATPTGILPPTGSPAPSSCITGTATSSPPTILMPPAVMRPSLAGDIVGVVLQNNSERDQTEDYATFGQVFKEGDLATTAGLRVRVNGTNYPAQVDPLALWSDGSVKMAAVTVGAANVCARTNASAMLQKVAPTGSLSVAISVPTLSVTLMCTSGCTTQTIDLGAAISTYLAGNPSYFMRGPLASQIRYDTGAIAGTGNPSNLHITIDLTQYANGGQIADIAVNRDYTPISTTGQSAALAAISYSVTTTFNGHSTIYSGLSQHQYTAWHELLASDGTVLTDAPRLNVQHDLVYLEHAGAVLSYDRTTGVNNSVITNWGAITPGIPLSQNNVNPAMGASGGRADIGWTTEYDTTWIMTGDARAAQYGMATGDTGGTIPWNFKLLSNEHWLTPDDYPHIWTDPRATNPSPRYSIDQSYWVVDPAHQPNLGYIPYIMTAERWYLDRLNAQAAFALNYDWPGVRCPLENCIPGSRGFLFNDLALNFGDQEREQAWNMREIGEAALIGYTGSWEKTYFLQVLAHNWSWAVTQERGSGFLSASQQGQLVGYISNCQGCSGSRNTWNQQSSWQQDYLSGTFALLATLGDAGAKEFVGYQKTGWMTGRFNIPTSVNFWPWDCASYRFFSTDGSGNHILTWANEENSILTNQPTLHVMANWGNYGGGDYVQLAYGALGAAITVYPDDTNLGAAWAWLTGTPLRAAGAAQANFRAHPTFNVVPIQP